MAMIQLYNRDDTDFQGHNGKILSEVYDDTISWELNTKFEFEFSYPMFGKFGLAIEREMIITAPVPGYDDQAFRVDQVTKSMGVLTVHAYHVFWDLMQNFIEDTNIVNKDGNGAISQVMTHTQFAHDFSYTSTVGNVSNARIVRMSVIAALIGTDDNTVLSRWGGEFEWDNFHFNHVAQLGEDRGVVFRNGKNLLGYKATEDLTDTVTRIMPEGYNGLFLPEKYVDSPLIGNYTSPRIAKIEYSDIKAIDEDSVSADNDDKALPVDQALDSLRAACRREFDDNHLDQPTTTYELNVVTLEDTEEYKNSGIFSKVYPGDTATFIHSDDKLDVKARMTGYTWQPSVGQYLTLTFNSKQRNSPDIEHKIEHIGGQITVIDKAIKQTAANQSNSVTYSTSSPTILSSNKEGDLWYQSSGIHTIMWMFTEGSWQGVVSDISGSDASNLVGGTFNAANVNVINLNGRSITAQSISADKFSANAILVGLNDGLNGMEIGSDQILMKKSGKTSMILNQNGLLVTNPLNNGEEVGYIHSNTWEGHPDVAGLTFDLNYDSDYFAWGRMQTPTDSAFTTLLYWLSASGASSISAAAGFVFSDNALFRKDVITNGSLQIGDEIYFANTGANIRINGVSDRLTFTSNRINGSRPLPSLVMHEGSSGMALDSNETWLFGGGSVYRASEMGRVGSALAGGTYMIPTDIDSGGNIQQWKTFNF